MTEPDDHQVEELVALAGENRLEAFIGRAWRLAPADLADTVAALRVAERTPLLAALPPELAARALPHLSQAIAGGVLAAIDPAAAGAILERLADHDAVRVLRAQPPAKREQLLATFADRRTIDELLRFEPTCAGGAMTMQILTVTDSDTVAFATEALRRQARGAGAAGEIFVVDMARRLVGCVSFTRLLTARPDGQVREIMDGNVFRVRPGDDCREAARLVSRYRILGLAVVDEAGRLLGCVTSDVALAVRDRAASEELLRFAGASPRELSAGSWRATVSWRLPRLYANLVAAFLAAAVVYFFQSSVARIIALAVWMPIVAGIGGGAATQAFAIATVRGRHGESGISRRRALLAEGLIGAVNGVAIGIVVGAVAVLLGESWRLGLVVFLAMAANLALAGLAGSAVPALLERLGVDSAMASSTFVVTLIDVTGLALLLGLATAILL